MIDGMYTFLFLVFGRMAGPHAKFVFLVSLIVFVIDHSAYVSGIACSCSFSPTVHKTTYYVGTM